jgi:hypothetical protein
MMCATCENGMRSRQNDVRNLRKWCAQLAEWRAPHFENTGCHWENDVRVDVRIGVRVDVRYRGGCACSAAHIIFNGATAVKERQARRDFAYNG